jgi:hypothetical protein
MSIIGAAEYEMKRAGFAPSEIDRMTEILELFFDTWDSGGAVWAMAPVLQKLIAGKPLSPLTGQDDEWFDHGAGDLQNIRLGTVFKDRVTGVCHDLDNPDGGRVPINFPYSPKSIAVSDPVVIIETDGKEQPK